MGANYSSITGWGRKALTLGSLESRVAAFSVCRFITVFPGCWGISPGRSTVAIQKLHNSPNTDDPGISGLSGCSSLHWDSGTQALTTLWLCCLVGIRNFHLQQWRGEERVRRAQWGFYRPWPESWYSVDKNSVTWLLLPIREARKWSPATCPGGKGGLFEHRAILCLRAIHCLIFWFIKSGYYILYKDSVKTNEIFVSYILPKDISDIRRIIHSTNL